MERKFFGTDGVRDLANSGNMTPEFALKLGRAFIKFNHGKKIIIGSDTRLTGKMLEGALSSGISSEGADVYSAGIIPTPGVSFAIKYLHADGGAVISASHNPAEYNGIKFLGSDGCKLSDEEELEIENLLFHDESNNTSGNVGNIYDRHELVHAYARHIASFLNDDAVIDNTVFDCANGASAKSVPILVENTKFSRLNTKIISRDFNGLNINKNCGVMNMKNLTDYVVENK
ncbi:MAG: phosphoglucosamine mutase, partial [Synergistaceae bacterium]|nr:phosphoglucosamine mutase [Synergistaceae bacterium]